jgi:hypothetical protein
MSTERRDGDNIEHRRQRSIIDLAFQWRVCVVFIAFGYRTESMSGCPWMPALSMGAISGDEEKDEGDAGLRRRFPNAARWEGHGSAGVNSIFFFL